MFLLPFWEKKFDTGLKQIYSGSPDTSRGKPTRILKKALNQFQKTSLMRNITK